MAQVRWAVAWRSTAGVATLLASAMQAWAAPHAIDFATAAESAGSNPTNGGEAAFFGLGSLDDGAPSSKAMDVSSAGEIVVGVSNSAPGQQAFLWSPTLGMVGLGDLPGGAFQSVATGVSLDGGTVVGWSESSPDSREAFLWKDGQGMAGLGDLPGPNLSLFSGATAASADGSVVVGWGSPNPNALEAFRWTAAGGMVGLGDLPDGIFASRASGVSADGTVVVGWGNTGIGINEAFRWTAAEGMVGLGFLPNACLDGSQALDLSGDGTVIVGWSWGPQCGIEAFRLTAEEGMVGLGDLPGGGTLTFSFAFGVSGDGKTVVGQGQTDIGAEAFVWNDADGMRNLRLVLEDEYGLDLSGWILTVANAIAADGLTIVGWGDHDGVEEAWVARLPVAPCPGDLNGDGTVDADDLVVLLGCWATDDPCGDLNGDGVTDSFDLVLLLTAWASGGCR